MLWPHVGNENVLRFDGYQDELMNKEELKLALKTICESVDSKSSLYFLLSDSNMDRICIKKHLTKLTEIYLAQLRLPSLPILIGR